MRVLLVATHPIQYQVPWLRALSARPGFDLVVAFATLPGAAAQGVGFGVDFEWDLPLLDGFRFRRLDLRGKGEDLSRFFGLRAIGLAGLLKDEAPDAVILTGWNSYVLLQGLVAARRARIPALVRGETNALRRRPLSRRLLHRMLLRQYSACLVIGAANRRFYRDNGVAERTLFDCPYCVDNIRFSSQATSLAVERPSLRSAWRIEPNASCILFAGKLVPKKRPHDLIAGAARARERGADVHLLFAGEGDLRPMLEAAAREARVPATFAGFLNQTEIARAYVAADLLALPSDAGETWGLVVNEAMACDRPAIVSDLVGCREDLIVEGETGWSHPCGDIAALASRLEQAAADRGRLAAMGNNARRRLFDRFTVARAVEGTERACEFVLSERRR